jgi:hypothetical protein
MKRGPSSLKIVSGGQTGVDRAALDVARALKLPHGGWCPLGRRAEDGRIDSIYELREVDSPKYWVRTERNVVDSDATLILFRAPLTGGTQFTFRMTQRYEKPCWLVDLSQPDWPVASEFNAWLDEHRVRVLNVAGPRESSAAGIYAQTFDLLWAWLNQRS